MKIISEETIKYYSNTIGKRNIVDNVMVWPLFIQGVLGQNVLDPNWTWKTRILKQIFLVFLLIYVIFGTKDYLKDETEASSIAEAYYTLLITSLFPPKYLPFINNRRSFQDLYLMAKTSLFEIVKNDCNKKSKELLKKLKLIANILIATFTFPVTMYFLTAMWNYILGTRVTLSKTTTTLMPMTTPFYEVALILHTIYMFCMAFTFLVIDMWFVFVMYIFCVACDSLTKGLQVEPKGCKETDLEYAVRLNDALRMFYKNHNKLMEYLNILCDMYKWPTVLPLVKVLLTSCLLLFSMSEFQQIQWTYFLSNVIPTFIELFAYNWFGEQVQAKSTLLNMALLDFDWPNMRLKDKKNYLIIVTYMIKDFSIKTAVGNDLSLRTMTSVLKASYQAFAVLKTMEY